ncbi:MAG: serine--tRNA ligase [Alphaproteobacteria bacterium]|nr:serine--tRNA ligase [Alphaproteobacteria bacterium]
MFDIRWIRDNPDAFDAGLERRGVAGAALRVLDLDARRRTAQTGFQELQQRRNEVSRQVGQAKAKGLPAADLMAQVGSLKDGLQALEVEENTLGQTLDSLLAELPNLPDADVPKGRDSAANVMVRQVGTPPSFAFKPLDHVDIGERLGLMDFERGARLSGSRFVVLRGALARLERALSAFMLDLHTREFGYLEVSPPTLVREAALFGTGQLPKFADDLFRTTGEHWLIPSAEVPLTNLVAGEVLDETALPMRFTACTPCYRSEAGAAGKDTRGMLRQHQFSKVELVSIAHPDAGAAELERMTACAEEVLKRLGLGYRVMLLCAGDMGFSARRTYDIEVWMPGQDAYREISSCSHCGDFQARRMQARYRPKGEKGTRFVHTLNGSGLAIGRTLIALLENGQQADGGVVIPAALRPYMDGVERLSPA